MPREYITDIRQLTVIYPPRSMGLIPVNDTDPTAFVDLLEAMMIPQEAALKVQAVIGHELYDQVLSAFWPEGSDGSVWAEPQLPADRALHNQYSNIRLAELHMICAGVLDLTGTLRQQDIGRVRSQDSGSEAEFELRAEDAAFFGNVRSRHSLKAYSALARAGFTQRTRQIERFNIDPTALLIPPEATSRRSWGLS
ncbi:hypothetical protein IHN63_00540 [Deinococcus sp. 6YEL10]|uniref:hypothetical protein n=1 Tax=Deinococcus sp. 6YEL10 TaxID=2745870 RepID=UPI001E5486FF|nr:hypothetical protein [Deinococcus sp. 6YEL10]MCD0159787.1 hypothetical protein [Deinococcus sp. 6YEL10]